MKKFFDWANDSVRKFSWYHVSLTKLSVFAFTLLLAKYFPVLLSFEWYVYAGIFVLAVIPVIYRMFVDNR